MKEWSLNGKVKVCDTRFFQVTPQRGVTTVDVYLKEDIDRLRQELINDIERFPRISKLRIKEIIAKRFGYKK